jgi:hypothetical protein
LLSREEGRERREGKREGGREGGKEDCVNRTSKGCTWRQHSSELRKGRSSSRSNFEWRKKERKERIIKD